MYQYEFFKGEGNIRNQNTIWHEPDVHRTERESLNNHRGSIVWFTGLSGSGKSTLANALERWFLTQGVRTYVLDGDNIRQGLCKDLGFSEEDRMENIRRIGEVSKLMLDAGLVVITAFISPFRRDRQIVRELVEPGDFIEIFCDAPLNVCEQRDPKGLYQKARKGEIPEFTGISSPYEPPENPELILNSGELMVEDCLVHIQQYLLSENRIYLDN